MLGIEYLHSEGLVHGDLHGVGVRTLFSKLATDAKGQWQGNLLVTDDYKIQLTDFGMTAIADATPHGYGSAHGHGKIRWTAPELFEPEYFGLELQRPTFQSDIYAYSCVCVEVRSMEYIFLMRRNSLTSVFLVTPAIYPGRSVLGTAQAF